MKQITETSVYYWAENAKTGRILVSSAGYSTPEEVKVAIDSTNDSIRNSNKYSSYWHSAVRGVIIRKETTTTRDENKRLISQTIVNTPTGEIYPEKLPF